MASRSVLAGGGLLVGGPLDLQFSRARGEGEGNKRSADQQNRYIRAYLMDRGRLFRLYNTTYSTHCQNDGGYGEIAKRLTLLFRRSPPEYAGRMRSVHGVGCAGVVEVHVEVHLEMVCKCVCENIRLDVGQAVWGLQLRIQHAEIASVSVSILAVTCMLVDDEHGDHLETNPGLVYVSRFEQPGGQRACMDRGRRKRVVASLTHRGLASTAPWRNATGLAAWHRRRLVATMTWPHPAPRKAATGLRTGI